MPLPLTVSYFSKIQIGFTFLVRAHLGSPGQRAVKRVCVCVCVCKCCNGIACWLSFFAFTVLLLKEWHGSLYASKEFIINFQILWTLTILCGRGFLKLLTYAEVFCVSGSISQWIFISIPVVMIPYAARLLYLCVYLCVGVCMCIYQCVGVCVSVYTSVCQCLSVCISMFWCLCVCRQVRGRRW